MRWLLMIALVNCRSSDVEHHDEVAAEPPLSQPTPRPTKSVWTGRYVCAQGPTALVVSLDHDGMNMHGTFAFSALPENPTVPSGLYTLSGAATTGSGGEVTVTLLPGEWIHRPTNYEMVGLEATIDRERRSLRGKILYPSCADIELERTQ